VIRCALIACLLSTWTARAHAEIPQSPAQIAAEGLTKSAITAFERHQYASALALLRQASVLAPTPTVGLYVARSHVALGQLVEAAEDFRSVVESVEPSETNSVRMRAAIDARDELAQLRPRIPLVEFTLGDSELRSHSLRLVVDGQLVRAGVPSSINPGHHEVVALDADGEKARLPFELNEGESKTLGLSWRSDAARASKDPLATGSSSTRRTLGVLALGVGATGLGVGTVTGVAALTRYSAAEQHCPAGKCTEGPNMPENSSAFVALRTISAAGFVAGGVGIGSWLGLLLTTPTPSSSERPKVSPLTPVVGMGSAGARYMF
jgi:hypothetical protein